MQSPDKREAAAGEAEVGIARPLFPGSGRQLSAGHVRAVVWAVTRLLSSKDQLVQPSYRALSCLAELRHRNISGSCHLGLFPPTHHPQCLVWIRCVRLAWQDHGWQTWTGMWHLLLAQYVGSWYGLVCRWGLVSVTHGLGSQSLDSSSARGREVIWEPSGTAMRTALQSTIWLQWCPGADFCQGSQAFLPMKPQAV